MLGQQQSQSSKLEILMDLMDFYFMFLCFPFTQTFVDLTDLQPAANILAWLVNYIFQYFHPSLLSVTLIFIRIKTQGKTQIRILLRGTAVISFLQLA